MSTSGTKGVTTERKTKNKMTRMRTNVTISVVFKPSSTLLLMSSKIMSLPVTYVPLKLLSRCLISFAASNVLLRSLSVSIGIITAFLSLETSLSSTSLFWKGEIVSLTPFVSSILSIYFFMSFLLSLSSFLSSSMTALILLESAPTSLSFSVYC